MVGSGKAVELSQMARLLKPGGRLPYPLNEPLIFNVYIILRKPVSA